jgi:hypothetical protein
MKITYAAEGFDPKDVTGKYVRCSGRSPDYNFVVFETATCHQKGQFYGMAGMGYTLREYQTSGAEIPEALKLKCIKSKSTEKWI